MAGKNSLPMTIIVTLLVTASLFYLGLPAAAAQETAPVYYRVENGESLWLIGWKFEVTADAIQEINNLKSSQIFPGQVLQIPKSTGTVRELPKSVNYTVRRGDSLYIIGQRFGIGVSQLMETNGLSSQLIYTGQVLKVPLPPQQRYTVQGGDSLYTVAGSFKTNVEAIMAVNRMNSAALWIGQVLFVPGGGAEPPTAGNEPPAGGTEPPDGENRKPDKIPPVGGQWGSIPDGVELYHVLAGENLWLLAKRFGTTEAAIMSTNHLHSNLLQVNQPLFITRDSVQAAKIPYPFAVRKDGYGELLDWEYANWVLDTGNTAVLKDLDTGKTFKVRRLGGSNHADMEPVTPADTAVMKDIYGGQWSWNRRAVLVFVDGKVIAGSMAGMPHSVETITDNNFAGHFDLHFLNSRTHNTNSIDLQHQAMVQKAAGN